MTKALIHIGYHKTGTTWLQRMFYPRCPAFDMPFSRSEISKNLVEPNALEFCAKKSGEYFRRRIDSANRAGRIAVLSFERLSGSPHVGGRDSKEIAERLYQVLPDAKILIVIREQISAIVSIYKQYVQIGGTGSPSQYLSPPKSYVCSWFDSAHYLYEPLIRHYRSLFGADNVKVMLYEDFQANNIHFCNEILAFVASSWKFDLPASTAPWNPSMSDWGIRAISFLNRWTFSNLHPAPLLAAPGLKRLLRSALLRRLDRAFLKRFSNNFIEKEVRQRFSGKFSSSNRRLATLLSIDLHSLGYE